MKNTVSVTEVVRDFSEYVNRVAYSGERFVLTRGKKPVAELGPPAEPPTVGDFLDALESARQHIPPDGLKAFMRDVEDAHDEMNRRPVRDPWAS